MTRLTPVSKAGDMLVSLSAPGGRTRTPLSHLHPNDGVDEEQHGNQQADIGECLQEKQIHLIYHRSSPRGVQNTQVFFLPNLQITKLERKGDFLPYHLSYKALGTAPIWEQHHIPVSWEEARAHQTDLEGLHKGPEQDADGVTLAEQLDEPSSPEKLQEAHVEAAGVHQLGEDERVRGSPQRHPTPSAPSPCFTLVSVRMISVMLPMTVMKSKMFQVSRK